MLGKNQMKAMITSGLTLLSACKEINQISPAQAASMLDKKEAVLVDVREDKEWQEQHIPGAIHIPLGQLTSRLDELSPYKNQPLIMQCRSGKRSAQAAELLIGQGFQRVLNMDGGILAWKEAGLKLNF